MWLYYKELTIEHADCQANLCSEVGIPHKVVERRLENEVESSYFHFSFLWYLLYELLERALQKDK